MKKKIKTFIDEHQFEIGYTAASILLISSLAIAEHRGYKLMKPHGTDNEGGLLFKELGGHIYGVKFK